MWLLVFCVSFSWFHGLVFGLCLWHFLAIVACFLPIVYENGLILFNYSIAKYGFYASELMKFDMLHLTFAFIVGCAPFVGRY